MTKRLQIDALSTTEALGLVLKELHQVKELLHEQTASSDRLAAEVDRLRLRIKDPLREELSKAESARALGVSARTVQDYARRFREGDPSGLQGYYRKGQGGKEWFTTRANIESFKRANKLID